MSVGGSVSVSGTATYRLEGFGIESSITKEGFTASVKKDEMNSISLSFKEGKLGLGFKHQIKYQRYKIEVAEFEVKIDQSLMGVLRFELTFPDPTKPYSEVNLSFGDWDFAGVVQHKYFLALTADLRQVVWRELAKRAATWTKVLVRSIPGLLVRTLFTGQIIKYTGLASVTLGVGMVLAGITWSVFGLYMIGEASRKGREEGMHSRFIQGYVEMLDVLTDADPPPGRPRYQHVFIHGSKYGWLRSRSAPANIDYMYELLTLDWRSGFEHNAKQWIEKENIEALSWFQKAGRASLLQAWSEYEVLFGRESVDALSRLHKELWGSDKKDRYYQLIWHQFKNDGDVMKEGRAFGIPPFAITAASR